MLIEEQSVSTLTVQFMPKSIVLKIIVDQGHELFLGQKGVTASGGTVRYEWLAHVEAVGSHCGWGWKLIIGLSLNPTTGSFLLPMANSKMSPGIILPFIPLRFLPESNEIISWTTYSN